MQNKKDILIVEDHEITRLGLKALIQYESKFGKIMEAKDGESAVSMAVSEEPAVILMDVGLPLLDGIKATQQIKLVLPNTRILILSSNEADQEIFASFEAGADGYCLKDSSSELLLGALSTIITGAAWIDPRVAQRVLKQLGTKPAFNKEKLQISPHSSPLSARELDVLRLVVEGLSNQEIANALVVTLDTIKTHMRHIMEKLAVSDRTQAAVKALRAGLVD